MAAEAAHRHRPAPDQRAGRHHQLHHLRPRPAAARVRRRQGAAAISPCAARKPARQLLALDGKTYTLDESDVRDRRRERRRNRSPASWAARRPAARETTTDVLIESALWDAAQHRADRPQARHQFRRALSLRARRRSGLHACRGSSWRRSMVLDLCGGDAVRDPRRRRSAGAGARSSISRSPRSRGSPASTCRCRRCARVLEPSRLLRRRPGRRREGRGAVVAPGRARQGRHRRGGRAHRRRRQRAGDAVRARRRRRASRCSPPIQMRTRKAKRALAARGMVEAVTWSFISQAQAELFGGGKPELALANPIAADLSDMRPSLIPGPRRGGAEAMPIAASPTSRCSRSGQIFKGDRPEDQLTAAAGVRRALAQGRGQRPPLVERGRSRSMPSTPRPTRSRCSPPPARRCRRCRSCRAARPGFIPAARGTIQIGPQNVLGHFGELHPRALEALDADGPLVGLRGDPGAHPRAEGEGDARQAGARAFAVPAGRARFRLRRRPHGQGRRHRARGAGRRPQADRRRHACSTSTKARASSPARNRSRSRSRCSRARRP